MAVREIDALLAQTPQVRRLLGRYGVGPQTVEHQDDVEGSRPALAGSAAPAMAITSPDGRMVARMADNCIGDSSVLQDPAPISLFTCQNFDQMWHFCNHRGDHLG